MQGSNQYPTITNVQIHSVVLTHKKPGSHGSIILLRCDFRMSTIHSRGLTILYITPEQKEQNVYLDKQNGKKYI